MNASEFKRRFVPYYRMLYRVAYTLTGNASDAEDLLHDAFVVIMTSLDQLEKTDKPEPWMTAIVRNVGYHYQLYVKKEL